MNKKIITIIFLATILIPVTVFAAKPPLAITAKSAIVIEATTGEVLYEKYAEERRYPASTTKMMTIITALEAGNINDLVTTGSVKNFVLLSCNLGLFTADGI